MGCCFNIHRNLFPIYVLLLLLTLSHGRPSARIRESRYSKNPSRDSNTIISSLLNFHNPRLSLVKESSNSITSTNNYKNINSNYDYTKQIPLMTGKRESWKGTTTGSWRWENLGYSAKSLGTGKGFMSTLGSKSTAASTIDTNTQLEYMHMEPEENTFVNNDVKRGISKLKESQVVSLTSPRLGDENTVVVKNEDALVDKSPTDLLMGQSQENNGYRQAEEIMDGDETDEMGSPEDHQQLDKFRMSILKELGFETSQKILKQDGSTSTGYLSDIPAPTIPKWNISREEYIGAYAQYMHNVKQRKEKARANLGPRNRRKNAVTFVQTYYDNGSDHLMSEGGVMRTFSFDINTEPRTKQGSVRVRRATLSIPASCSLINGFRGKSSAIVGGNSSSLGLESEDDKVVTYDLTDDVTSWIYHADSSPFEVTVSCSEEGKNSTTSSSSSSDPSLRKSGSLRLVTAEVAVPNEQSRKRRSAPKSTLQNFENKPGKGRDCTKTRRGKTCCRRSLNVKFSELGISDVIIEPQEFDAHVCVGRCNAKRVVYSTTHAVFQHILHQTKGKKFAPRPCCTPRKLTELDVIHLDPTGTKLQVTVLKDAIVEECGCS